MASDYVENAQKELSAFFTYTRPHNALSFAKA